MIDTTHVGILVIDDQQMARQHIVLAAAQMVRTAQVYTAENAQEGMAQLVAHGDRIHLVLLDMRMAYKGILLIPHIHAHAPDARILPYTVDSGAAEQMEELGCLPRVPKILPAREIAKLLERALDSPVPIIQSAAFYRYIANDAADSLASAPPVDMTALRISILGNSDIELQGLRLLVNRASDYLALSIVCASTNPALVHAPLIGHAKSVMIGTMPQAMHLVRLHMLYHIPVLLYTRLDSDLSAIPPTISVLFETPRVERMADALATIAHGEVYDPVAVIRQLSARDRTLLQYVAHSQKPSDIAKQMKLTPSRVYHLLSELYKVPGLPDTIDDLRLWAQQHL